MAEKNTGFGCCRFLPARQTPRLRLAPPWAQQVNIMQFCQQFNAATQDQMGTIIPNEITPICDKSFTFRCRDASCGMLIKGEAGPAVRLWHSPAEEGRHVVARPAA